MDVVKKALAKGPTKFGDSSKVGYFGKKKCKHHEREEKWGDDD